MESNQYKLSPNPRESANCLSKILMTWSIPFFKKGFEKILKLENVFHPLKCDKSENLGDKLEKWVFSLTSILVYDSIWFQINKTWLNNGSWGKF